MNCRIKRFSLKLIIGGGFFQMGYAMHQDAAQMKRLQHMYGQRRRKSLSVIGNSVGKNLSTFRRDPMQSKYSSPSSSIPSQFSSAAPKSKPSRNIPSLSLPTAQISLAGLESRCLPPLSLRIPQRSSSVDPTRTAAIYRGPVAHSVACALHLKKCNDEEEDKELLTARALPVSERQKTASCKIVEAWMARNSVASDKVKQAKNCDGLDVIVSQASPPKRRVRFPSLLPERTVARAFPKTPPQRQQECAVSTNSSGSESEELAISFYNNGAQVLSCNKVTPK